MIIVVFGAFQFIAVILLWCDVQAEFSRNDSVGMVVLFCPAEALAALGDLIEVEVVFDLNGQSTHCFSSFQSTCC